MQSEKANSTYRLKKEKVTAGERKRSTRLALKLWPGGLHTQTGEEKANRTRQAANTNRKSTPATSKNQKGTPCIKGGKDSNK